MVQPRCGEGPAARVGQTAHRAWPLASSRCRARGWARLGAAQLCLGHPRAALSAYQRGLQMSPGSAEMQLGARLAGDNLAAAGGRRTAVRHADGLYE